MNRSTRAVPTSLRRRPAVWLAALLLVGALAPLVQAPPAAAQQGARVKAMNLAELVGSSGVILRGRVLSARPEKHPQLANLDTVLVTLRVDEVLKGKAGAEYSFRLFVWNALEANTTLGYKPGEEMLLMLRTPSEYGLSSPAGFEQGSFRFQRDAQGTETLVNGRGNRGLMSGVEAAVPQLQQRISAQARVLMKQHQDGPIGYTEFKDLVRGIVAARQ